MQVLSAIQGDNRNKPGWRMHLVCSTLIVAALAGSAYRRNGIWRDPVSLWEDTASKSPGIGGVYLNLGLAYHRQHRTAKALENYYKVVASGSASSLDAYNNIGSIFVDLGEYEQAVKIYSKLLQYDQFNARVYAGRGNAYYRQGRYDNAIEDFSRSLTLSPDNPEALLYRGFSYEKKGDRPSSLRDFTTACSLGDASACRKLAADGR